MTGIEEETFSDGFLVCLLGVHADRARNAAEYRVTLFDGGRGRDETVRRDALAGAADVFLGDLRRCVMRVAASPHILAAYGRGWRELLSLAFAPHESEVFRILDLAAAGAALSPERKTAADLPSVARAFGVALSAPAASLLSPDHGDVLWAVVTEAGRRGLAWPDLLLLPRAARAPAAFERYAFTADWLAKLPEAPAVYIMRDRSGRPLYVGKAAVLRRRVQDHFRPSIDAPENVLRLRERIHDIEYRLVGSELEALLLENRLIGELGPTANMQRRIAEGRSRYAAPLVPVALFLPSAARRRTEVFFLGEDLPALQVRIDLRRPPLATLRTILAMFAAGGGSRRGTASCVTDWGGEGREICRRYFGRRRERLRWMEIGAVQSPDGATDRILAIARLVSTESPDPAEFRSSRNGP